MSEKTEIGIFCGDRRHIYLARTLLQKGYSISTYCLSENVREKGCLISSSLEELFLNCRFLIGPIPFTKDTEKAVMNLSRLLSKNHSLCGGMIPSDLADYCKNQEISYYDLMKIEKIAVLNAIATAEGSIMEAIQTGDSNLHNSNCLVLGYGRCARILAGKLKGLDAIVTVAARSEEALAVAQAFGLKSIRISDITNLINKFDFIFNTIPALVLNQDCLAQIKQETVIIDIASAPGGIDYDYALQRGLKAKLCPGLPGKISPKSSADILANEIILLMKEGIP